MPQDYKLEKEITAHIRKWQKDPNADAKDLHAILAPYLTKKQPSIPTLWNTNRLGDPDAPMLNPILGNQVATPQNMQQAAPYNQSRPMQMPQQGPPPQNMAPRPSPIPNAPAEDSGAMLMRLLSQQTR